jgi:cyclohexadieny/prephenate dehydrogenase
MLGRFTEDLAALQRAIRWGEGDKLFDLFTRTRAIRRGVIAAGQAYDRQVLRQGSSDEPDQRRGP